MNSTNKLIKNQGRSFPVYKCYTSEDWEKVGLANILVVRKQAVNKYIMGVYSVDLFCLGLKDSFCKTVDQEEMDFILSSSDFIEIDYTLAHNIIYGSIAFAEDYGFKPHKSWKVSSFILEEDNEDIEFMDIPFGVDGVPCYVPGENDTEHMINKVLNTLDKTAGEGNYIFGDYFEEDDDLFEEGEIEDIMTGKKKGTTAQNYALLVATYLKHTALQDREDVKVDVERINFLAYSTIDPQKTFSLNGETEAAIDTFFKKTEGVLEEKEFSLLLENENKKDPQNPGVKLLLFEHYILSDMTLKANAVREELLSEFPDLIYIKLVTAFNYINQGNYEKGLEWLGNSFYIDEAFPDRRSFATLEMVVFYASLCLYFLGRKDTREAIPYAGFLLDYAGDVIYANEAYGEFVKTLIKELDQ